MINFTNFVARRYMRADRQNAFFSWISILSIAGIAIGVAAMIVVLSVINAFERELRDRFLAANAHILLYRFPAGLENYPTWIKQVKKDLPTKITAAAPFVYYETMAKNSGFMHSVLIRGIIPSQREKVQPLSQLVRPLTALNELEKFDKTAVTEDEIPPIIIGKGLLTLLNAKLGDTISLISPAENSLNGIKKFRVIGTYFSGLKHYDDKIAFMGLRRAQGFFNMHDLVTGLEIGLKHPENSVAIAEELGNLYPLSVREWQSYNKPIFQAMEQERVVIGLIVALVAIVATFNILTTMFVAVTQKQKDISILKALGATNATIKTIFIKQGALIAVVGSILGVILSLFLSWIIKNYDVVDLPDIYLLSRLPIEYNMFVYVFVAIASIFMAILASLGPAIIASRVSPTEGFRGRELQA